MVKSECSFILIIIVLLAIVNCNNNQENYFANLKKNEFHWVVFTNPSTDCIECINRAITIIDDGIDKSFPLTFLLQKSDDIENFQKYIQHTFKKRKLIFIEENLKLNYQHPSILLVKNKTVYMYFFIHIDIFFFSEYFNKCRELFLSSDYQVDNS